MDSRPGQTESLLGLEANIDGCSLQRLNDTENVFYRITKRTMLRSGAGPVCPHRRSLLPMTARRMVGPAATPLTQPPA